MTAENNKKAVAESREKLVADLKSVISDAQELANGAKDASSDAFTKKAEEARAKLKESTEALRRYEKEAEEQVENCAKHTEDRIRRHPWQSVGIVALAGFVVGRFLK